MSRITRSKSWREGKKITTSRRANAAGYLAKVGTDPRERRHDQRSEGCWKSDGKPEKEGRVPTQRH